MEVVVEVTVVVKVVVELDVVVWVVDGVGGVGGGLCYGIDTKSRDC